MIKGYKGFDKNLCCRGFQYEVGEIYETNEQIKICDCGFHFCQKLINVNEYYAFNNNENRYCEIEALGDVINGGDKSVTNKIKIVRELSKSELLDLINVGKNNTGKRNTGYCNTGDCNTGDCNTGDCNTGDWNTGKWNTGDWNTTDNSSGVFCTKQSKINIFNKKSDITLDEWRRTLAYIILNRVKTLEWIVFDDMTSEEKEKIPNAKICNGYLKQIPRKEATKVWWKSLTNDEKKEIFNIPNFDLNIFNEIMELNILNEEYERLK